METQLLKIADSVVAEIDMDEEIVEKVVYLCQKHNKKLFGCCQQYEYCD